MVEPLYLNTVEGKKKMYLGDCPEDFKTILSREFRYSSIQSVVANKLRIAEWLANFFSPEMLRELEPFYSCEPNTLSDAFGYLQTKYTGKRLSLNDFVGYEGVKKHFTTHICPQAPGLDSLRSRFGISKKENVLLYGPPGCGKTLLSRCISDHMGVSFVHNPKAVIDSSESVFRLFDIARKLKKAVLFLDDLELIVKKRVIFSLDESMTNYILSQLDGHCAEDEFVFIGATNYPERVDPAFYRPGRLDNIVYIPLPDQSSRKQLFEYYLKEKPLSGIDFTELAEKSEFCSCADIKNFCHRATHFCYLKSVDKGAVVEIGQADVLGNLKTYNPSGAQWFDEKCNVEFGPFGELFSELAEDIKIYKDKRRKDGAYA